MAIVSPANSFVDFNTPEVDCDNNSVAMALPVYEHFGVKFQIKVEDELLSPATVFKAAVCTSECDEVLYSGDTEVLPICPRWIFGESAAALTDDDFPLTIGSYSPDPGQPQLPEGSYDKQAFFDLINQYYEYLIPAYDYYSCCEVPPISGIVVFYNGVGLAKEIGLNPFYGYGYIVFPEENMTPYVGVGECFRYCILDSDDNVLTCSNIFTRISNECLTSVFNYYNKENAFGFKYVTYDDEGITRITENQIRLWATFDNPKHVIEEEVFRQSDNIQERLSTVIQKEWIVNTGYLSIRQHDQLVVMLKHDVFNVYNKERAIDQRMVQLGAPEPEELEMRNYPTYPTSFTVRDFTNSFVNNNCGFNCGIEFVEDCDAGGVVNPCPDKFKIETTLGTDIDTYQNDLLIGKSNFGIEVYREGIMLYTIGDTPYSLNSGTGVITFTPAGFNNERIAIIEI